TSARGVTGSPIPGVRSRPETRDDRRRASSRGGGVMTLPVSTSGGKEFILPRLRKSYGVAVSAGVVCDVVGPAAPDHTDPGAGQNTHGVWVVVTASAGCRVDLRRPGALVATVVGEDGDRAAEAFVTGPSKMYGTVLAGFLGHRGDAGERGDGLGTVVGLPAVAPLGEHLGSVDLTGPWQRCEDLTVRMLP